MEHASAESGRSVEQVQNTGKRFARRSGGVINAVAVIIVGALITLLIIGGEVSTISRGFLSHSSGLPDTVRGWIGDRNPDSTVSDAVYQSLGPTFVFSTVRDDSLQFVQVMIEVGAREQSVLEDVRRHIPEVRHRVAIALQEWEASDGHTASERESLRMTVLEVVNRVLQEYGSNDVDSINFTAFVVQ